MKNKIDVKSYIIAGLSGIILLLFFTNWITINAGFFAFSTGPSKLMRLVSQYNLYLDIPAVVYIPYIIPLLAVATGVCAFFVRTKEFKIIAIITNAIIAVMIIGALGYVMSQLSGDDLANTIVSGLVKIEAPLYLTVLSAIGCIVLAILLKSTNTSYNQNRYTPQNNVSPVRQAAPAQAPAAPVQASAAPAYKPAPAPTPSAPVEQTYANETYNPDNQQWFTLTMISGDMQGLSTKIAHNTIIIGRNPTYSNIVLKDLTVSRKHCGIYLDSQSGKPIIESYSQAGTWINQDKRLYQGDKCVLNSGDVIYLGNKTQIFKISMS